MIGRAVCRSCGVVLDRAALLLVLVVMFVGCFFTGVGVVLFIQWVR